MSDHLAPEWEKHKATLFACPQASQLWQGCYQEMQDAWVKTVALLSTKEEAHIFINPLFVGQKAEELQEKLMAKMDKHGCNSDHIRFHSIPTNDIWIRDYGPLWVNKRRALVFEFDGWGRKYIPYEEDASAGLALLQALGHQALHPDFVLEGGAIDTDGETLLVSDSCMLFRSPFLSREEYERKFRECFGIKNVLWLKGGLPGDGSDGHVDLVCRFIDRNAVLYAVCEKDQAPYPILEENRKRLQAACQANGEPLDLKMLPLPLPPQLYRRNRALPRSYANFYIANQQLFVPVYNEKTDEQALKIIQDCFPKHEIQAIDSSAMILQGGAVHCMTMNVPHFAQLT